MDWLLIDAEGVIAVHDRMLNPGELAGLAGDRSLEGALTRVENRIVYGLIGDVHDLAVALARGHVVQRRQQADRLCGDGSVVLRLNGAGCSHGVMAAAERIIAVAAGQRSEEEFAAWLRVEDQS